MVEKTPTSKRQHRVQHDGRNITFQLHYRKRKSLTITVNPDTSVDVAAPLRMQLGTVQREIREQADWILKQQRYFAARPPPPGYRHGAPLYYLGQPYRLQISTTPANWNAKTDTPVALIGTTLRAQVADPDNIDAVREQVQRWYRQRAEQILPQRLQHCVHRAAAFDLPAPTRLTLRHMKTRWGSCSQSGRVTLNTALMQADLECIDYVILHELCHLRVLNHSPRYYRLLDQVLPDWRRHERRLNDTAII